MQMIGRMILVILFIMLSPCRAGIAAQLKKMCIRDSSRPLDIISRSVEAITAGERDGREGGRVGSGVLVLSLIHISACLSTERITSPAGVADG